MSRCGVGSGSGIQWEDRRRQFQLQPDEGTWGSYGARCLTVSGLRTSVWQSGMTVYLSRRLQQCPQSFEWSTDGLVLVPSFRPSHAPWPTRAGLSISQFGTVWSNPGRCTFTDCGLVNLVWALEQAGSGPLSVGQGRAKSAAQCTEASGAVSWVCNLSNPLYCTAVSRAMSAPLLRPSSLELPCPPINPARTHIARQPYDSWPLGPHRTSCGAASVAMSVPACGLRTSAHARFVVYCEMVLIITRAGESSLALLHH